MEDKKIKNLADSFSSGKKYHANPMANAEESLGAADGQKGKGDFNKLKEKLEGFKKKVLKKFPFTKALGVLPANSFVFFEEDEALPKEIIDSKPLHVIMLIPEEKFKDLNKIKPEVVNFVKETGENLWVHIKTVEVDLWNYGLDLKFEMVDAIAMSYPLHDDGFLGALRVTVIHKNLVLNWLNTGRTQYVATYAIGGSLVRGTADKTSDIDTFVIIDDTDVKRMSRVELVEKLRGKIVSDFLREATALAGVKNLLSPQVWLLTDFWQRVKDAEPVAFTFIRDGIPLYDKGTFIPWKRLLQMGKIKPSPEAIDLYMKEGDRTEELLKRRMIDSMIDVYYGVLTPAQAMMMLAGQAPPIHKDAPRLFKETFYDKEKLVDMKYVKILEKVVKLFKDYEHGRLNDISGKEIDELRKEGKEFNKMVKELRSKIEKRMQEHEADRVYKEVFGCLEIMFGKKGEGALLKDFELEMVDKGKISKRFLEVAKEVAKIDEKVKSKKFDVSEMQRVIKDASELVNELQEYSQRKELVNVEKGIVRIYAGNKKIEVILTDAGDFVFDGEKIRKIAGGKLVDSSKEEMEKALAGARKRLQGSLSSETLEILKREYGNFAINL